MIRAMAGLIGLTLAVFVASGGEAAAIDEMQGAWTMDGTICEDVFRKDGDEIRFIDRTSSLTTGIIVSPHLGRRAAGWRDQPGRGALPEQA